ncbi:type I 3-dehydroquinate dehydratase [Myxococcota bacterium]|nr:type I 3-dehydroquinate dehydratase [Myxococcota bacterium]MBU1381150.1 type I 3-dehydroquinate dehydratase [Myxococcota bacterium]MBU1496722.1 type I 3-dehydroquinate dehydratase [Myxococcota bacterium]
MICLSGNENTLEKLICRIKSNSDYINEVRLDLLDNITDNLPEQLIPWKSRLIITHRSNDFIQSLALLEIFSKLDYFLIDIELEKFLSETVFIENHFSPQEIMISYHGNISNLNSITDLLLKFRGYRFKFAVNAQSVQEYQNLLALSGLFPDSVLIATGKSGLFTRLRYRDYNSYMTYLSTSKESSTDSGQIDLALALQSRINITGLKPVFLFGGNQISKSPGMKIYNKLFTDSGLELCYINHVCKEGFNPVEFLEFTGSPGASVTMPHKKDFLRFCHELDISAEKAGSVNTIVNINNVFIGYNTDYLAFIDIFSTLKFNQVVIAGDGATSHCAVSALNNIGVIDDIVIVSRKTDLSKLCLDTSTLFINTIPVGVNVPEHPFSLLPKAMDSILLDLDYTNNFTSNKYSIFISGLDFWKIQGSFQMSIISGKLFRPEDL